MVAPRNNGGHSVQVKIQLLIDGGAIPVAQLGPDFLLHSEPFNPRPGNAGLGLQDTQRREFRAKRENLMRME